MYLPKWWFYPLKFGRGGMTAEFIPMDLKMPEITATVNPSVYDISDMGIEMPTVSASLSQMSVGISSESVSNP